MSAPPNTPRHLVSRLGVLAPVRVRAFEGIALLKIKSSTLLFLTPLLVCGVFGLSATPALAAGSPEIGPEGEFIGAPAKPTVELNFEAAVNPNEEATECHFQYGNVSVSEQEVACEQGGPIGPPQSSLTGTLEGGEQRASVNVKGLTAGTPYRYRVVLKNASGEKVGAEETVATVAVPHTGKVEDVTATTAKLTGELAPLNAIVPAGYYFFYGLGGGSECRNESTTSQPPYESAGVGTGTAKVTATAEHLQPNKEYTACLVSTNEFGGHEQSEEDPVVLPAAQFTTAGAPPSIDSESAPLVTPYEAILEGQVNPNNEATSYHLEYATSEAKLGTAEATSFAFGGVGAGIFGDQRVGLTKFVVQSNQLVSEPEAVTGLEPDTKYFYRVVAENAKSKEEGKPAEGKAEEFTTEAAKEPEEEAGSGKLVMREVEGQLRVSLEAQLNPNNEETGYHFEYAESVAVLENPYERGEANHEFNAKGEDEFVEPLKGSGYQTAKALLGELTPGKTYYYRIVAENETTQRTGTGEAYQGPIRTFQWVSPRLGSPAGAPTVTQHTALVPVPAIVPEVLAPLHASYYILYGPNEPGEFTSPMLSAGSGTNPNALAPVQLAGLQPGTTYHYEVVASSAIGQVTGPPQTFTTAPGEVFTAAPTIGPEPAHPQFVNETSAVIEGELNPGGLATSYEVQYGTSAAYGSSAQATAAMGPFTSAQGTLVSLAGLAPGTTYHYRLVATNAAGTTAGPDETFTTAGAPQPGAFTGFAVPSVPLIAVAPYTFPTESPVKPAVKPKSKPAKCPKGKTRNEKGRCVKTKQQAKKAKKGKK